MSGKWFTSLCKATYNSPKNSESSCLCSVAWDFSKAFKQRSEDALTGSQFMQQTETLDFSKRQLVAIQEIIDGNMPDGLRIPANLRLVNNQGDTLLLPVTRDYLAIGSDTDFMSGEENGVINRVNFSYAFKHIHYRVVSC